MGAAEGAQELPFQPLKILQVIHGYPMRYNAGSEVYTQGLAQALAKRHEVHVFTRQENAFLAEYAVQKDTDPSEPGITLHVVNMARARDGYRHQAVDEAFARVLEVVEPEVVHIGLLNHLSTSLPCGEAFARVLEVVEPEVVHIGLLNHLSTSLAFEARDRGVPVVFTLHDYWLMCPRGQFIQMYPENPSDPWAVCDGQDDRKCAVRCYSRYFSGDKLEYELDAGHWTQWVGRRMAHVSEVCDAVDVFIAPAMYLPAPLQGRVWAPRGKACLLGLRLSPGTDGGS